MERPTRTQFTSAAFALMNETDCGLRLPKSEQAKGYADGCYMGISFGVDKVYGAIEELEIKMIDLVSRLEKLSSNAHEMSIQGIEFEINQAIEKLKTR